MTKTVGRNEPCPCGSGRQYKKCCLANGDATDVQYRRWLQVEAELIPKLFAYAFQTRGPEAFDEAWTEFNSWRLDVEDAPDEEDALDELEALDDLVDEKYLDEVLALDEVGALDEEPFDEKYLDEVFAPDELNARDEIDAFDEEYELEDESEPSLEYDPQSPMNMVFMPWFFFNWLHEAMPPDAEEFSVTTIAQSYYYEHDLSADEERFLLSVILCPFSLCEVVEVNPGVGMTLFDLLRRIKYEVVERSASQTLKRAEIIYCATTQLGGISSNIATSPYALRATAKRDVLELRKWILQESENEEITEEELFAFEDDIRGLYLELVDRMLKPPQLTNTDNDPLVPQTIYFDLESPDQAFHALKDLAEGVGEDDLRVDATLVGGEIETAEIPWLGGTKEARKRLGGPVLLGTIKIENRQLIVSVNSGRRAETICQLIEERLGQAATYKTTRIEPIEVEKLWQAASNRDPAAGTREPERAKGVISLDDVSPELRAKLEQIAREHWINWLDLPVPALNNMTPREAAKTEEGRDLLGSLLLLYESHEDDSEENLMRPDLVALRRELGLEV